MSHILTPPELMTAEERAGWRMACERMRQYGARMEMSGRVISDTPALDDAIAKGELLSHCGKMIRIVADLTEDILKYSPEAPPTGRAPGP
ncbi:hypothetical protein D2T31_00485 [Sinirhodobacter populi]|uniref:Uncharacterized protein n=1 Tax=Paenirhodobacter populi TaxID=2306993 RepID=A0A443KID7_9RHOB|nr:hypothetical protein [Sinirhodobacter populi]RWR32494.1 hypothetical protein D2T31_00485 [Sinirhodobacter populi]